MDGIKLFQNVILYIFLHFFILHTLVCKEYFLEKTMPLIKSEIDYDYDKMIDAQKDQPLEDTSYEYSLEIMKAEKEFLKNCSSINLDDELIGDWRLVDKNDTVIKNHSFLFNEFISISKYKNDFVLDNWGNRSLLYLGSNNRYYIYTRGIGIIRMIKINEEELSVYIIKNKKWVLDPIHNDGEYIFKKISAEIKKNDIDMSDWFQKL